MLPMEIAGRMVDGENLVKIRREYRGMTISAPAEKAAVSQSYVSQIESDARDDTISAYKKLDATLNAELADLV